MNTQENIDYQRIEKAIVYLRENFKNQPTLDEIATHIHMSPFHFQRMFTQWAGVSPKKFLQFITVEHAKKVLKDSKINMLQAANKAGLSSSGRLHDLFIKIEGMTPGEYKNSGEGLSINYSYHETLFGRVLIASTTKGICYMGFSDSQNSAFQELQERFSNATFVEKTDDFQKNALQIYGEDWSSIQEIKLHLKGTDFQLKVWSSLLKIPLGNLSTYGTLAQSIDAPGASRAVGTAIGKNPIAFLIPCHRVIQSSGKIGGYMWNPQRKTAIIGWELAKRNN